MNLEQTIIQIALQAKQASYELAKLNTSQKDTILHEMAASLMANQSVILAANEKDMAAAKSMGLSQSILDRLLLNQARLLAMSEGFLQVAKLKDPVGKIIQRQQNSAGLMINKVRVPIGVIAVIYESRPNVTADVTALCLKTSNAVILRGGSDAFHSNQAIAAALLEGGHRAGLPQHAVQIVKNTDRLAIKILVQQQGTIDLVIPRGGEDLIQNVVAEAKIPVIKHYKGICHIYVAQDADLAMALSICENAKCQRPGVCNAVETVLIHQEIAERFLPLLVNNLEQHGVEIRADVAAQKIIPHLKLAHEQDWYTEYLDLILSVKIVENTAAAIQHINHYGSHHSDAIISSDEKDQQQFSDQIDSAVVYINASTRFTDGEQFGMGAEIGISTDKLHARGPMGLEELTTYKYIVQGNGQIRQGSSLES
jgi:glutamate-5-semialdehyde dehydrogenase